MKMKRKQLMQVNGGVFLLVAVVHLLRVLNDWQLVMNTVQIPVWASGLAVLLTAYLAYQNWSQAK